MSVRRIRQSAVIGALAVAPLVFATGCASQLGGLAPVGGDGLASIRTAATDVLIAKGYAIIQAPVCTTQTGGYTCAGTIDDGSAIAVQSPTDLSTMTITVGGTQVFSGSVNAVLESAAAGTMQ